MKTLLLLRHAKSDWGADYGSDHDRPLNERGVRSARIMGGLLASEGIAPQFTVSSTALRARATFELANEAGRWDCPVRLDRDLYETGPVGVLAAASGTPDVDRLMLVGHQPVWSMLVHHLTGAFTEMKTASVAVIKPMIDRWSDLPSAFGELEVVHNPRKYFGSEFDGMQGSGQ